MQCHLMSRDTGPWDQSQIIKCLVPNSVPRSVSIPGGPAHNDNFLQQNNSFKISYISYLDFANVNERNISRHCKTTRRCALSS